MTDKPRLEIVPSPGNDSINLHGHDPKKIRQQLGVDRNTLLSPQQPRPITDESTLFQILTHNGVFSPEDCEQVLKDNVGKGWQQSLVQRNATDDERAEKLDIRNSANIWLEKNEVNLWMFDKMLALTMSANKLFTFEVDFFEALQLARYEVGQFYGWHCDLGPGLMGNRKLSVTVQLSAPDTYEGGDLILDDNGRDFVAPRELGSVTVFPSFMKHKVTPVTKGTRYSLVVWASGTQRFR